MKKDHHPGLHPRRLAMLMRAAIERCQLDLSGSVVLTEAASGAYVVTPVLAAMAGAEYVYALTRSTRYGTLKEVAAQTLELASLVGVQDRIEVITQKCREVVSQANIVTNSGHIRPIDAEMIAWMKPTAVISLMYEAWEFRPGDVDLATCRQSGILVADICERHPAVDVFSFLGMIAVKLLMDARVSVYASRILLLCDNPFGPFIERGLLSAGASVDTVNSLPGVKGGETYDAILVALQPRLAPVLPAEDLHTIAHSWPGAVIAQLWGDIDRSVLSTTDVPVWPLEAPAPGHMGILLSDIGPEPVVRLQAGGLKSGELLWRQRLAGSTLSEIAAALEQSSFAVLVA
jgi:hypothetical protein